MPSELDETLGKPRNELDARMRESYMETVEACDADLARRNKFKTRSYSDFEREVRGASGLDELIALHGAPQTSDGVAITVGSQVFRVVDLSEPYDNSPADFEIRPGRIENLDFIFNHWTIKLEGLGLFSANELYATRLAATERAIELYRREIEEIETKIDRLRENL